MITAILLVIIYFAFISLGLPDSILGVAIPSIREEMLLGLSLSGIIATVVIAGSVISSFFSDYVIKRVGTGRIVFFSCLITGFTLLGFSVAPSYIWLIILALPLGLGGGTVDASLNNYVALHFKAHHMNWLHSFWGVGATIGPIIMSWNLIHTNWRVGYRSISAIQLSLAVVLLLCIPIWKKHKNIHKQTEDITAPSDNYSSTENTNVFKIKTLKYALLSMILYCSIEHAAGLWGSSYLVGAKNFPLDMAAKYVSMYYLGITIGRFLSGFISFKLSNIRLIRGGIILSLFGAVLLVLPLPNVIIGGALVFIGFGLAPIFPSMLHETPVRFGKELSQKIIGIQMAFAYIGSAVVPVLLSLFYQSITITLFPLSLLILIAIMLFSTEMLNIKVGKK